MCVLNAHWSIIPVLRVAEQNRGEIQGGRCHERVLNAHWSLTPVLHRCRSKQRRSPEKSQPHASTECSLVAHTSAELLQIETEAKSREVAARVHVLNAHRLLTPVLPLCRSKQKQSPRSSQLHADRNRSEIKRSCRNMLVLNAHWSLTPVLRQMQIKTEAKSREVAVAHSH
eukprot:2478995-Rhodomonas_salina.2